MTLFLVNGVMLQGACRLRPVLRAARAGRADPAGLQARDFDAAAGAAAQSWRTQPQGRGGARPERFDGNGDDEVARGERAVIAVPEMPREGAPVARARLDEAKGLAEAIGIDVVARKRISRPRVRPATLFGKGQVEEVAELAKERRPSC